MTPRVHRIGTLSKSPSRRRTSPTTIMSTTFPATARSKQFCEGTGFGIARHVPLDSLRSGPVARNRALIALQPRIGASPNREVPPRRGHPPRAVPLHGDVVDVGPVADCFAVDNAVQDRDALAVRCPAEDVDQLAAVHHLLTHLTRISHLMSNRSKRKGSTTGTTEEPPRGRLSVD